MPALVVVILVVFGLPVLVLLSVRKGDLAEVEVTGDEVVVRPRGLNRVWALKGEVRIPMSRVAMVRTGVARKTVPSGVRMPGTAIPGLIQAGTYRKSGEKSFWLVGRTSTVTVIDCPGASFDRVVLQLADETAAELQRAADPGRI